MLIPLKAVVPVWGRPWANIALMLLIISISTIALLPDGDDLFLTLTGLTVEVDPDFEVDPIFEVAFEPRDSVLADLDRLRESSEAQLAVKRRAAEAGASDYFRQPQKSARHFAPLITSFASR